MAFFKVTYLGLIGMEEKNGCLTRLWLGGDPVPPGLIQAETPLLIQAFNQLDRYLAGELHEFSIPLNPEGTPFMKKVWNQLGRVPYGQTATYKDVAVAIGNPRAVRAVGQANRRNPIPIFIPCHRIIGSRGDLVGFSCGLEYKRQLLALEQNGRTSV